MESLPFKEVILSNDEIYDRGMFVDETKRITLEGAAFYVFGGGTVLLSNLYSGDKIRPELPLAHVDFANPSQLRIINGRQSFG